ncbi:MAG TPA: response regulator transcription factor [Aurantimonas coralicida]|uniref:Response regulator transcription factor n=2 Tax=root TaxID=1 RepID=A0A9C9NFP4_9HYPH|nr:response regulator transcription factor [Aurantimonas coralicida]HEU01027.1 response regulator transcription factor [Aurantimonas coralicida]
MRIDETTLHCLVADDEPHIRDGICCLAEAAGLKVIASAANGTDALHLILRHEPAIAFLDIRMPGLDGLELVGKLCAMARPPVVVYVTAHDEHAIAAFELSAIDYVMKLIETKRFGIAVDRAKAIVQASTARDALDRLNGALASERPERLTLRSGSKLVSARPADILRFQAVDDYVEAHLASSSHVLSITMNAMEQTLSLPFLRVHRSHIVNVDHIRAWSTGGGRASIEMSDGVLVSVSRSRKDRVQDIVAHL